jgi:hypothetical protein
MYSKKKILINILNPAKKRNCDKKFLFVDKKFGLNNRTIGKKVMKKL